MADTFKYCQLQVAYLAGSGAVAGATSITLSSFTQIDGTALTMTDFGSIGFGTLEPNNSTQEEQICFTGITQNASGTATLTGVKTVLTVAPYTQTSGLAKAHPGGAKFVISNTAGFYDKLTSKSDDETITGVWTFPDDPSRPRIPTDTDTTEATGFVTLGQLSRQAISGASNASTTVKGIVELPTQAEMDAKTTTGATGAKLSVTPDVMRSTLLSDYIIDTGTKNAYAIAPSPAITAYTTGQRFVFKAINANDGTSTLAVNGLTAQPLRAGKANLRAQYIRTNWCVGVVYDGTGFEIESASAQVPISQDSQEIYGTTSTGTTAYVVGLVPVVTKYTAGMVVNFKADVASKGGATININSLGVKNILRPNLGGLSQNDIIAGQVVSILYDGTQFLLNNTASGSSYIQNIPAVTTTNSSAPQVLLATKWVAGKAIGTNGGLLIKIPFLTVITDSAVNHTIQIKSGGVELANAILVLPAKGGGTGGVGNGVVEIFILNNNSASSQNVVLNIVVGSQTAPGTTIVPTGNVSVATTSVNTAVAHNYVIYDTKSSAAAPDVNFYNGIMQIIN